MDDLQIEDNTGGRLKACQHNLEQDGYVVVKTSGTLDCLNLGPEGARWLVDFLERCFPQLADAQLEALEDEQTAANFLRIVVPGAAGGDPREVTWSGDDEPPAWFERLAGIAIGERVGNAESAQQALRIRRALALVGINVDGAGVVEGVRRLVEVYQATAQAEERASRLARTSGEVHDALLSAGFDGNRTVGDIFAELITIHHGVRAAIHAEDATPDAVVERVRELYRAARMGMRRETHPKDRSTVRDMMAQLGIDQSGLRAHETLAERVAGLLGDVDIATSRAKRAEAEVARLQRDAVVAKLSTAREGLEYARLQFIDSETGGPAAVDWTDVVSRAIVDRLDEHISGSDPEA
jgi:hypothetical protein